MKSRKKILRLFSRLNIGGPAIHVVNLSVGLPRFGYDTLLVVGSPDESEGTLDGFAREQGAELVVIPSFQAKISPWKDLLTLVKLIRLMRKERPDIVHTHTFKAGLLGRLAARITGVPVVIHTYHGHLLTGYGSSLKASIIRLIETGLGFLTDHMIAVSDQVAKDLVSSHVTNHSKMSSVELGFDMRKIQEDLSRPSFLREDLCIPQSAFTVGIVGRLVPVKAVDLFLTALCPLLETNPDLHLLVLGDGTERKALELLARVLTGHQSRIHFTGWRRPVTQDLPDLDLCICSSKNEGTSVSIIEAVVARVPVMSTRVGGMADLLGNGRWGQLIDSDPFALRSAVEQHIDLMKNTNDPAAKLYRERIHRRVDEAAEHFQNRFSVERLLTDVDGTYRKLLNGSADAHPQ